MLLRIYIYLDYLCMDGTPVYPCICGGNEYIYVCVCAHVDEYVDVCVYMCMCYM